MPLCRTIVVIRKKRLAVLVVVSFGLYLFLRPAFHMDGIQPPRKKSLRVHVPCSRQPRSLCTSATRETTVEMDTVYWE